MVDSNNELLWERGGECSKTSMVRRDNHDNERARPLAVVSAVLLRANEIHSAQNSLLSMKQHLRSPQHRQDWRRLTH